MPMNMLARPQHGTRGWHVLRVCAAIVSALSLALASPASVLAANTTYTADTSLVLSGSGINLTILSGSNVDSLSVTSLNFTVTVAAAETFTVRYPGPNPGRFPNNGVLPECHLVGANNDFVVVGPKTVTVTPSTTHCSTGGGGAGATPPSINLQQPDAGTFTAGDSTLVIWSIGGEGIVGTRLALSTDSGATYPTQIGTSLPGNSYNWTVPNAPTIHGRVLIQGLSSSGTVLASDASAGDFVIVGSSAPETPPPSDLSSIHFVPSVVTQEGGATISDDKGLPTDGQGTEDCPAQALVKLPDDGDAATQQDSTVYYCGRDGHRWVFPNSRVFFSWYQDFSSVVVISAERMARIPIGRNVTYRPGLRMIKMPDDSRTYAVSKDGILHLIPDEATARALYGPDWKTFIDDIDPAFFADYEIGAPVTSGG